MAYNLRQPSSITTHDRQIVLIPRDPRASSTRNTCPPPVTTKNRNYKPNANHGRGLRVDRQIVQILRDPRGSSTILAHPPVLLTNETAQNPAEFNSTSSNNVVKTTNTDNHKGLLIPKVGSVPSGNHKETVNVPDSKVTGIKKLSTSVDSWENKIAIGYTLDDMVDGLAMRRGLNPVEKLKAPENKVVIKFPAYLVESKSLSLQKWLKETEKWDELINSFH